MRVLVYLVCLLVSLPASAQEVASDPPSASPPPPSQPYDVIRTNDGRVLTGKILRETAAGYLFRSVEGATFVVEFTQIADLQSTAPGETASRPDPERARTASAPPPAQVSPAPFGHAGDGSGSTSKARLRLLDQEVEDLNASRRSQLNAGLSLGGGLLFVTVGAVGLACCVDNNPSVKTSSVVSLVAGGLLAITGGIMLGVNASHNNDVDLELRRVETERKKLALEAALRDDTELRLPLLAYSTTF